MADVTEVVDASEWAGLVKRSKSEDLHDKYSRDCRLRGLPPFVTELRFAKSIGRQWKFDFAFPEYMVAVEIEGLVSRELFELKRGKPPKRVLVCYGRHATLGGIEEDMVKYNAAALLGWTVLRFNQKPIKKGEACDQTIRVLHARGWRP